MDLVRSYETRPVWKKLIIAIILVVICVLINLIGARLVALMGLPLYFDCTGTMIAGMFGGIVPGVLVGLLSSLINTFISNPNSISYTALNVLIGLFTARAQYKGWFYKFDTIVMALFNYVFLGGFLGAIITLIIYGGGGDYATSDFANYVYSLNIFGVVGSEIFADVVLDFLDKSIEMCVAMAVLKLVPPQIRGQFRIHRWRQAPLTTEAVNMLLNNKTRKRSLKTKVIIWMGIAATLLATASVAISYFLNREFIADFAEKEGLVVSNEHIVYWSTVFLVNQISIFIGVFILVVAIFMFVANYDIVLPLNTISYVGSKYSEHDDNAMDEIADLLTKLRISTGDEIEYLYDVITNMTKENSEYIEDIRQKNNTISDMQNALIVVLADIVESRDHNTGNHIKSTAEYVELIMDEMLKEGVYLEQLTPEFISDVYQSAALHDIGKITVSDMILNKPGKLTDEEFAQMKRHTIVGADIIDGVIKNLPESSAGYLNEARNLALYHHEKWNGTGYPYGISGEEIPLSARIMAVADVFDALVSKRSYKEAFSFEKAIGIIEESAGSHFDPLIVKAFLNARDRIKIVAEEKDLNND